MNSEEILVALAVKYNGDWESIMDAMKSRTIDDSYCEGGLEAWARNLELEKYFEIAQKSNYRYTTMLSDDYPQILKQIHMPPFVLFYYGKIFLLNDVLKNVSVVGSRECSVYGERLTRDIVRDICGQYVIVSGMARGIDTVAHKTAIENGGRTIAVLGSGIDVCYPPSNKKLYNELKENHLVISEYPGRVAPQPFYFPRRNRIIAAISRATLVTEANARSGTLTTVMFACQNGRDVLCLPYPAGIGSECNRIIKSGGFLVENGEDVRNVLNPTSLER